MYRTLRTLILPVLAVSLILFFAGCNEANTDTEETSASELVIEIAEQPEVSGWLDIVLPSSPVAMAEFNSELWILTVDGFVMKWTAEAKDWHIVQSELTSLDAFSIAASELGVAVLSSEKVIVFGNDDTVTEIELSALTVPLEMCASNNNFLILYSDGSVDSVEGNTLESILSATEKEPTGSLCYENGLIAWMNNDNSVAVFDLEQSLLTEVTLPDGCINIDFLEGEILAGTESLVYTLNPLADWEEKFEGTLIGNGMLLTDDGFTMLMDEETLAASQPMAPDNCCVLNDGTVWTIAEGGIAVWASIGEVETRFSDAEVQLLRYQVAGQTGGGSAANPSINDTEVSMGGVFRIYESVSSRPDPFSEFPLASRDLRRELADLTIEELHIVGITLDPSGGDQAMVEDANGVAYILFEGTQLRNNTHIAEITSNEVIVVQEVTVGSSEDGGGSTTIPTIFSMRLHEEGGL